MTTTRVVAMFTGVALAAVALGHTTRAQQREDVLPALLTEVRALRNAIEQMATAGARVQLAMGRLQMQEQRVNGMLRRIDEVRSSIEAAARSVSERRQELAYVESHAQSSTQADVRTQFERQLPSLKAAVAQAEGTLQRLQTEEADLQAQVAAEQQRWVDINRQLEELDRILRH